MAALLPRDSQLHGRGVNLVVISIVFTAAALFLVVARVIARSTTGRKLGWDDHAIIVSVIFSIGLTISNCVSVEHGVGKNLRSLTLNDVHVALQSFWIAQILYKLTVNLTKISICLLYLRIFPNPWFRRTVYVVMAYVLLYAFSSIIATVVQCVPLERIWNHTVQGHCINLTAFWYANATANILGDCLLFGIPMPVIKSLKLPRRQRVGLILIFGLGAFVCITSVLRMTTLKTGSKATDVTYGTLNSTIWSTIEANTAIICACLPMLKSPLTAMFPSLFPRGSSQEYSSGSGRYIRHANSRNNTIPSWTNVRAKKASDSTHGSSTLVDVGPSNDSTQADVDEILGVKGHPMGLITKTTDVNVDFDGDAKSKPSSNRKHAPPYPRTLSEAHLIGSEHNMV